MESSGQPLSVLHTDYGDAELIFFSIVAVHGLNGDPTESWTHPDTKSMWIKDSLPLDVPNVRVMSFGYNANVAFGSTTATIMDHARDLLSSLVDEREEEDASISSTGEASLKLISRLCRKFEDRSSSLLIPLAALSLSRSVLIEPPYY
jgi:hypothetical protein